MVYLKKRRAKTKRFTDRFPTIVENLCRQTQYAACIAACVRERVYVCAEGEGEKLYKSKQGKKKKRKTLPDHFPIGQIRSSSFFSTFGSTLMYLLVYEFGRVY